MNPNGRHDVGWLEKQTTPTPPSAADAHEDLSPEYRRAIAEACDRRIATLAYNRAEADDVRLILKEFRRDLANRVSTKDLPHDQTMKGRGGIAALDDAIRLLTNPEVLAETRKEMVGDETSFGEAHAGT